MVRREDHPGLMICDRGSTSCSSHLISRHQRLCKETLQESFLMLLLNGLCADRCSGLIIAPALVMLCAVIPPQLLSSLYFVEWTAVLTQAYLSIFHVFMKNAAIHRTIIIIRTRTMFAFVMVESQLVHLSLHTIGLDCSWRTNVRRSRSR